MVKWIRWETFFVNNIIGRTGQFLTWCRLLTSNKWYMQTESSLLTQRSCNCVCMAYVTWCLHFCCYWNLQPPVSIETYFRRFRDSFILLMPFCVHSSMDVVSDAVVDWEHNPAKRYCCQLICSWKHDAYSFQRREKFWIFFFFLIREDEFAEARIINTLMNPTSIMLPWDIL